MKDTPASQGSKADDDSVTSGSASKGNSPADATRITDAAEDRKGLHTLRSTPATGLTHTRSFTAMQSVRQAFNDSSSNFALPDRRDTSRDTAAAAEAQNAEKGVASGSTRKDASDTGRPSESAPTASEVSACHCCVCVHLPIVLKILQSFDDPLMHALAEIKDASHARLLSSPYSSIYSFVSVTHLCKAAACTS